MDSAASTESAGLPRSDIGHFNHAHESVKRAGAMVRLGAGGMTNAVMFRYATQSDQARVDQLEQYLRDFIRVANEANRELCAADGSLYHLRQGDKFLHIGGLPTCDAATEMLARLTGPERQKALEAMQKIIRNKNAAVKKSLAERGRRSSRKSRRR
jgi:hypothetical protein